MRNGMGSWPFVFAAVVRELAWIVTTNACS
jgi:hypothetical protein